MKFFKDKETYSLDRIETLVENYTGAINKDNQVQTAITNLESTYERNKNLAGATAGLGVVGIFAIMASMSSEAPLAIPLISASTALGAGGVVIATINKIYKEYLQSNSEKVHDVASHFREEIIQSLEKLGMSEQEAVVVTKPENVVNNNLLDRIKNVRRTLNLDINSIDIEKPKNKI